MITSKLCMLPWVSMEVTPMGTYRPCCVYKETIPGLSVQQGHTIADAQHSNYMVNLRQQFMNGEQPIGCQQCWDEEKVFGRSSKRRSSMIKLKDVHVTYDETGVEPIFLDLKLGNICNLKCRICGSWSSSKWAQEEIDLANGDNELARQQLKDGQWPRKIPSWWDSLEDALPYVEYLEFTGGEPFLINEHFDLLQELVDRGLAKNIDIHYNTNGTSLPDRGIELWPNFRHVEIAFSIDDTGERFEYQRFGARWKDVDRNVRRAMTIGENVTLQICTTFNVQNAYYWPETALWIQDVGVQDVHLNILHEPPQFCLRNIPQAAKEAIAAQMKTPHTWSALVDGIIGFMMLEGPDLSSELLERINKSDAYRKQSFADTHREMYDLLVARHV